MKLLNPTGKGIRNDSAGLGHHNAPRGSRKHDGVDLLCDEGQDVISPISGEVIRMSNPYLGDNTYKGLIIGNEQIKITMFYLEPTVKEGDRVAAGDVVGIAQDISKKHGGKAHIHLRINNIDPMVLMEEKEIDDPGCFISHT
jgi:murein DD-endopeptidase MepM/ murein hydrolase activator NlpD